MIEVDGFRLNGGGDDFNNTTKRDTPFPNSSSTPLDSIQEICDDPSDPNYWKENIATQEEKGIKVPINQPEIPLTEFAERLIALEQENVALRKELGQLKEVTSVMLSFVGRSIPLLTQYYDRDHRVVSEEGAEKLLHGLWEWAEGNGIEFFPFDLSADYGLKIRKDEEDKHEQTDERVNQNQSV